MVSIAQGLRMLGGGKDTSGYADMLDSMEVRDLLGERRAEKSAVDAQDALMEQLALLYGDPDNTGDIGNIYETPTTGVSGIDEDTGKFAEQDPTFRDKYLSPFLDFFKGDDGFEIGSNTYAEGGLTQSQTDFQNKRNFGIGSLLEQAYESGVNILPIIYDILGVSGFEDGGRVGMFLGGTTASGTAQPQTQLGYQAQQQMLQPYSGGLGGALVGLINQNPQIQQQLQGLNQQNYNLPNQVQNQMYTPPTTTQSQQPYNPFVTMAPVAGTMGFYDPSTLDMPVSNDPVMLGGPDPYQTIDPYVTPSYNYGQGPRPADQYGIGLSSADIAATFADKEKFSLEAQRRKAEAVAAEKKAAEQSSTRRQHPGGGGGRGD
jgi:hypothetical protein